MNESEIITPFGNPPLRKSSNTMEEDIDYLCKMQLSGRTFDDNLLCDVDSGEATFLNLLNARRMDGDEDICSFQLMNSLKTKAKLVIINIDLEDSGCSEIFITPFWEVETSIETHFYLAFLSKSGVSTDKIHVTPVANFINMKTTFDISVNG